MHSGKMTSCGLNTMSHLANDHQIVQTRCLNSGDTVKGFGQRVSFREVTIKSYRHDVSVREIPSATLDSISHPGIHHKIVQTVYPVSGLTEKSYRRYISSRERPSKK